MNQRGRRPGDGGARAASLLGQTPTLAAMAWRNLWRNPARSALTVAALAGSLVLLILYLALVGGMTRQMQAHATDVTLGQLQLHRQAFIDDQDLYATLPWALMHRIEADLPGLRVAPRLYAAALASTTEHATGVLLKAVDPQREPGVTQLLGNLRSGRADFSLAAPTAPIAPGGTGPAQPGVLVGAQLARNMQLAVGDELVLVSQAADASIGNGLFRVAGVLQPVDPGFDRSGVLMSVAAFQALMVLEQGFHELAVSTAGAADAARLAEVQAELQALLAQFTAAQPLDALGGPAQVRSWRQIAPALADMLRLYDGVIWVFGLIVVGLAALGMLNTMLMAIHERTREFGLLRAIGMHKGGLLLMVMFESLALALVSAALGSALGLGLVRTVLRNGIDLSASLPDGFDMMGIVVDPVLRVAFEPAQLLGACTMVVGVALGAALLPAWRATRTRPAQAMQ